MAKGKKTKKAAREQPAPGPGGDDPALPPVGDGSEPAEAASEDQLRFDMPYSATAPRLVNPELGLHNLMARAGHNAAYTIDVTLLDADDHRLIRSGVLLAHRVLDGRGEWYLSAPDWEPLLPRDRIELMGDADLPETLADLIRPIRRRATLGPVAALHCDRREFALRDDRGTTMALLRDDKVTVRRGGLTTARYRQVLITPIGPRLTEPQLAWLDRAFTSCGANRVARFPRLVQRLGAPATGPTDLPAGGAFAPDAPFRRFVSELLALRLRGIVEADLAVRSGDLGAAGQLATEATQLRRELSGLAGVLDADWVDDLRDELDWVAALREVDDEDPRARLTSRLRSERYLTVLDRLVTAARTPRLAEPAGGGTGGRPTSEVLTELLVAAGDQLRRIADQLAPDAEDSAWSDAQRAADRLHGVTELAAHVLPKPADQARTAMAPVQRLLAEVLADQAEAHQAMVAAEQMSGPDAFAAGRRFERQQLETWRTREKFAKAWGRARKKLTP